MNSSATEISERLAGPAQKVGQMPEPAGRKPAKDPMKRFPFLFQFSSSRLSGADSASTTGETRQNRQPARTSRLVAFRSPSDQLCVLAMPCWQGDDRSE